MIFQKSFFYANLIRKYATNILYYYQCVAHYLWKLRYFFQDFSMNNEFALFFTYKAFVTLSLLSFLINFTQPC